MIQICIFATMIQIFMKRYLPILFVLLSPIFVFSQQSVLIEGKITDAKTNKPLAGASIFIHELKQVLISDENGHFKTQPLKQGHYLIEVSYTGYASALESIDITKSVNLKFALKETIAEQEAVTVTGVSTVTRLKTAAQPISIIKKEDLLHTTSNNIIEAISNIVPGVSAIGTGPAISNPVIRGLGYNRIITIHDGLKQEGQQWGEEHGIEIDEYSIQRVEILKGPASVMYGSDAIAGVLNLQSNVPVVAGNLNANINTAYNSNNGLYVANANVAAHHLNGFNWNVYGTYKSAGDYSNKYDGKVFNSRFNEKNFGGYIGINKKWGYSHLLISNVHQRIGMIEGSRDATTGAFTVYPETPFEHVASTDELNSRKLFTPYQSINHFKISSDNSFAIGSGRLNVIVGYQHNKRKEFGDPEDPNHPELFFNLKTVNYNLHYQFAQRRGWKTTVGINGMQQSNQNLADEVIIPEYNLFDAGAFVYSSKTINKNITLSGGLRADIRKLNSKAYEEAGTEKFKAHNKDFSNISGTIGASWEINDAFTLKANIARGFRAPNVAELFSNGAHEGTNRYEYGNTELKSETSVQGDLGLVYNTQHFTFGVNAFYNSISNFIFYSKLSAANGGDSLVELDGEALTAFKFDQSNVNLAGFEMNLDLHPHPLDWLHFENTISFVRGRFQNGYEGNKNLPFMPAPRWKSELRGDFKKAGNWFRNVYAKLEMDYTAEQTNVFTAYNTETITPQYSLFNIGLGTSVINKNNQTLFTIQMALNNVFDVAYQNHLSRLKYTDVNNATGRQGVFNMGRNFSVKLNIPLSAKI